MLDQTFSAPNFRRLYDLANRRGLNLDERYFPQTAEITAKIKAQRQKIASLRLAVQGGDISAESEMPAAREEEEKLRMKRMSSIDDAMATTVLDARASAFKLEVYAAAGPAQTTVYPLKDSAAAFFVGRQIQRNLQRLYKVKPANRHQLVAQIADTVRGGFPLQLVRTDISSFFESIDRARLLQKLDRDELLGLPSKRLIKQLLKSYQSVTGSQTGLPRGVGVSSYLSELYLKPLDQAIRDLPGLVLYCRYVDDIVAVFAPPPAGVALTYADEIESAVKKLGLSINQSKTETHSLPAPGTHLDYLGYRFSFGAQGCLVRPSTNKLDRYKKRLERCFGVYHQEARTNQRNAGRNLKSRVGFLTGNTRLLNSKSQAATGIYYSNMMVGDLSGFLKLDGYLAGLVATLPIGALRTRLGKLSFKKGFVERVFHSLSTQEIGRIVKAWKHVQ